MYFLTPPKGLLLTEDARETLVGVLDSTKRFVEKVAGKLLVVWAWRKENPNAIPQPKEQWPKIDAVGVPSFRGYRPDSVPLDDHASMTMHPDLAHRFKSAALDDGSRAQWANFD